VALQFMFPPSLGPIAASARVELVGEWLTRRMEVDVQVAVAADYGSLIEAIVLGSVDLAWAPPAVCAYVRASSAAVYKAVRAGRTTYRGAIVARDSITEVTQLEGRRAAWVDPLATAGYLLPLAYLRAIGIRSDLLGAQSFVGSYGAAVRAVISDEADFMAIYTPEADVASTRDRLRDLVGDRTDALGVLAFTDETPNDGLIVAARPGWQDTQRAIDAICDEHDRHVRPSLLHQVFDAERLVLATDADYAALRLAMSA
jgi:ABC-type phosphate/phosphonate transport system substrate-binding protein